LADISKLFIIQTAEIANSKVSLKDWIKEPKDMTVKLKKSDNTEVTLNIGGYTYDKASGKGTITVEDYKDIKDGSYQVVVQGLGYMSSQPFSFTVSKSGTQTPAVTFNITDFTAGDIVNSSNQLGSDGKINAYDFNAACTFYSSTKPVNEASSLNRASDLNRDGKVDISDIAYIINNWIE
jgi:hypothetical protein